MRTLLILALVAFIGVAVEGKKFSQCALVKELLKHGIPKNEMANWICLIEHESGYNTKATHRNTDGSIDYGLFQVINMFRFYL
uniref:lysozyme n=1 Tax=Riptortus pedestris TaxID=329032 RepID=R4WIX6_RIPPE|nr:unkown protein [Riptortus pedestris]